jgi:hypothetical protein
MTYGEAIYKMRETCKIQEGLVLFNAPKHRKKMSKKEAVDYYSKKLSKIWKNIKKEMV